LPAGSRACPHPAFGRFWCLLHAALTSSGRVLFVDDQPASAGLEIYGAGSGEMVERCPRDGTRHQLIKVVRGPADITRQLTQLGWQAAITPTGDWLVGQAWPTPMPQPGPWPHGPTPSSTRTALMTKLRQLRRLSRSACCAGSTVTLWSPDRSAARRAVICRPHAAGGPVIAQRTIYPTAYLCNTASS
jgi:hypothetical protein